MRRDRWESDLASATSEGDVIYVVRDYGALLSRQDMAKLPVECRPPAIRGVDDISDWALEMLRRKLSQCSDTDYFDLVLEISDFLSSAQSRLAELRATAVHGERAVQRLDS
jgi:hypothetical protein